MISNDLNHIELPWIGARFGFRSREERVPAPVFVIGIGYRLRRGVEHVATMDRAFELDKTKSTKLPRLIRVTHYVICAHVLRVMKYV